MRRTLIALVVGGLVAVTPGLAQQKGTWELGGFGRFNRYDSSFDQIDSTKNQNSWGGGARLGYFFSDRMALELDGSVNATDVSRTGAVSVGLVYMPFHLRAVYNAPLGSSLSWLLGAGINYNRYNVTSEADQFLKKTFEGDDWGVGALTGFRLKLNEVWSIRADGTLDFIPSPQSDSENSNTMLGAQLGLSVFLGGRCTDKLDSIRVEPRNATVIVGEQVNFIVRGYYCDGSSSNVTAMTTASLAAGATATLTGATFSSNTPGTYQVAFNNPSARKVKTDAATVTVNPRPAPPVTLDRVDLQPDAVTIPAGGQARLRVMGFYTDGSSRELTNCQLTPDGGTVTNSVFTATRAGTYTVTAICEAGKSDRSTITVEAITVTIRALFEFDQTNVYVQAERDSLRWLAGQLQQHPGLNLTLYGHTDWVGSVSYNAALGDRRIKAVADSLVAYGVPADRIRTFTTRSYGECQPIADNRNSDGRRLNRRVEIFDTPNAKQYEGSATCRNRP